MPTYFLSCVLTDKTTGERRYTNFDWPTRAPITCGSDLWELEDEIRRSSNYEDEELTILYWRRWEGGGE